MHKDFNVIIQNLKVLTKHPQETCLPNCKEKDERQKERKKERKKIILARMLLSSRSEPTTAEIDLDFGNRGPLRRRSAHTQTTFINFLTSKRACK